MLPDEQKKKLETLPWQALYDLAVEKEIDETEISGQDKNTIISRLLSTASVSDEEINKLVENYIYGKRVTFTIWTFNRPLSEEEYNSLFQLSGQRKQDLDSEYFRNLQILSIDQETDRLTMLYVYSKEYNYIDEEGHSGSIWEQHRGCLWIGKNISYLACISKHDRMTTYLVKFISGYLDNKLTQIHPPKEAIKKCINFKALSRIVLQGADGEKTIISRAGGLTEDQEKEMSRIRDGRIDTSGSYIAGITEDISASVKYNTNKGSIGILKHLPTPVLFDWSQNAISTILEEIEKLKGKPAAEIFKELGLELKWSGYEGEKDKLNWFLTQAISSLKNSEELVVGIDASVRPLLDNRNLFYKIPRMYCSVCESYEVPCCSECGTPLQYIDGKGFSCSCGAAFEVACPEGHSGEIVNWYMPTAKLLSMIERNVQIAFKNSDTKFFICVLGDQVHIVPIKSTDYDGVEIQFSDISCFSACTAAVDEKMKEIAVFLNEKCVGGCTKRKIETCSNDEHMVCLPKLFYSIIPGFRLLPHKGGEYGDVSGEVSIGDKHFEMKGIIKKNTKNTGRGNSAQKLIEEYMLSTSSEGQELIRQFIEQGMTDSCCQLIAVIAPQYFDNGFKGTLRYLARLSKKKLVFIELDEICKLITANEKVNLATT